MARVPQTLWEISLLTLPLSLVSLVLGLGTQWSQAMHCEAAQTTQTGNINHWQTLSLLRNMERVKDSEVKR